jgi:HSP20 family protein
MSQVQNRTNNQVQTETEGHTPRRPVLRPVSNIIEEDGKVVLRLEMPGVDKDNVDVRIEDDHLVVEGQRPDEEVNGSYVVRERRHGDYFHRFTLDDTVDREKVDAKMEHGVLTVTLNLKESVKPRKVQIKSK